MLSPDGQSIAYIGFDDRYQGYQVRRLYVMSRDGSGSRLVTGDWDRDVSALRWAPDGSGVYFLSDDQGDTGLYFVTLNGQRRKIAGNVGASNSAYAGGGAFTVARNGAIAFTYARPNVPGDWYPTNKTVAFLSPK